MQSGIMKPSIVLQKNLETIRRTVARHPVRNLRVFGSVIHHSDGEGSDLDLLVDPIPGTTLFDLGAMQVELETLLGIPVSTDAARPPQAIPRTGDPGRPARMSEADGSRLLDYLDHMVEAISLAKGLPKAWRKRIFSPTEKPSRP